MPSPIAHSVAGLLIFKVYGKRSPQPENERLQRYRPLLLTTIGLSLLPDLDSVAGILLQNFGRYHNSGSHSLFVGLLVALGVGGLVQRRRRAGFAYWFFLTFFCYAGHILLDYFTWGRGVKLLWPFSAERFSSPVRLFYGLHWSDGFVTTRHIWTVLTELVFVVLSVSVMVLVERKISNWRREQSSGLQAGDLSKGA